MHLELIEIILEICLCIKLHPGQLVSDVQFRSKIYLGIKNLEFVPDILENSLTLEKTSYCDKRCRAKVENDVRPGQLVVLISLMFS